MYIPRHVFYFIFFVSGFSALIYESIWAHYLKLFLGHAAYAQTLVLAIFMGGMALGSAISAKYSPKWKNLLLGYAVVEGVIGLFAILFHGSFIGVTDLAFETLIPMFSGMPLMVMLIKWGLAASIILPQSILLGMTFPLMVAGILRRYPDAKGRSISTLYFTNSFGAVLGVLVSSFVLIGLVGLPGTILTAGVINIFLALIVWVLTKEDQFYSIKPQVQDKAITGKSNTYTTSTSILLVIALLTGMSSFMYEIGWIRMLSLVLGSTTHSFEIMLAVFILGIALGGLWLRKRIDHLKNPRQYLGYIQIIMGFSAVFSIFIYHYSFDFMQFTLASIQQKESTYPIYLVISGFICIVMMLPATFCAGMTLPLITNLMTNGRHGERGIGAIYAANTCGAIVGIFISVHLIMPMLDLKALISIGAGIDIVLGLVLLGLFVKSDWRDLPIKPKMVGVVSVALFCFTVAVFDVDKKRLSSGVFRYGTAEQTMDIKFYKDGKTSSVSVYLKDNILTMSNNGKPDASMSLDPARPNIDETTQVFLGMLPLLHKHDAKTAAVIGLGSGVTPNALLASNEIERVDSVEIESAVVEGSKLFKHKVERVHSDPRSHIFIDDAKTFFSTRSYKYDIIVSEPPNPWVSGVSSLFTREFYRRIKNYMNDDAVFVQWLHLYDIDLHLMATVFNAIGLEFSDYLTYTVGGGQDIIIVATKNGKLPALSGGLLQDESIISELEKFKTYTANDVRLRQLVNKSALDPYLKSVNRGVNSDYFPLLDNNAASARFAKSSAQELLRLAIYPVPMYRLLPDSVSIEALGITTPAFDNIIAVKTYNANMLLQGMLSNDFKDSNLDNFSDNRWQELTVLKQLLSECKREDTDLRLHMLHTFTGNILPFLSHEELTALWRKIESYPCINKHVSGKTLINLLSLYEAISVRDHEQMLLRSESLLGSNIKLSAEVTEFILVSALLGSMGVIDSEPGQVWERWKLKYIDDPGLAMRFMLAQIGVYN